MAEKSKDSKSADGNIVGVRVPPLGTKDCRIFRIIPPRSLHGFTGRVRTVRGSTLRDDRADGRPLPATIDTEIPDRAACALVLIVALHGRPSRGYAASKSSLGGPEPTDTGRLPCGGCSRGIRSCGSKCGYGLPRSRKPRRTDIPQLRRNQGAPDSSPTDSVMICKLLPGESTGPAEGPALPAPEDMPVTESGSGLSMTR